jgi:hypothetical protein
VPAEPRGDPALTPPRRVSHPCLRRSADCPRGSRRPAGYARRRRGARGPRRGGRRSGRAHGPPEEAGARVRMGGQAPRPVVHTCLRGSEPPLASACQ